MKKLKTI